MIDIHHSWEDNIEFFFMWIDEVCGLHKESKEYKLLKELIQKNEDVHHFVNAFDGNINDLQPTINLLLMSKAV